MRYPTSHGVCVECNRPGCMQRAWRGLQAAAVATAPHQLHTRVPPAVAARGAIDTLAWRPCGAAGCAATCVTFRQCFQSVRPPPAVVQSLPASMPAVQRANLLCLSQPSSPSPSLALVAWHPAGGPDAASIAVRRSCCFVCNAATPGACTWAHVLPVSLPPHPAPRVPVRFSHPLVGMPSGLLEATAHALAQVRVKEQWLLLLCQASCTAASALMGAGVTAVPAPGPRPRRTRRAPSGAPCWGTRCDHNEQSRLRLPGVVVL